MIRLREVILRRALCSVLVAAALMSASCATVSRGRYEVLEVNSEPSGATVTVSNGEAGVTPAAFLLRRKRSHTVTITREGFASVVVEVTSQPSRAGRGASAANAAGVLGGPIGLLGGAVGAVVDKVSGATKDLKPNPVDVKLVPRSRDEPTPAPEASAPAESLSGK